MIVIPKLFQNAYPNFVQRALSVVPDVPGVTVATQRLDRAVILVIFPDADSIVQWFTDVCPELYQKRLATKVVGCAVMIIDKNINEGFKAQHN